MRIAALALGDDQRRTGKTCGRKGGPNTPLGGRRIGAEAWRAESERCLWRTHTHIGTRLVPRQNVLGFKGNSRGEERRTSSIGINREQRNKRKAMRPERGPCTKGRPLIFIRSNCSIRENRNKKRWKGGLRGERVRKESTRLRTRTSQRDVIRR